VTFSWPAALAGLALLPLAVIAYLVASRRKARFAVTYPNVDVLASVARHPPRRWLAGTLLLLAATAMVLGLARPRATVLVPREDASVVLVMDVSGSMANDDVEPSRLDAAKAAARTFVSQVPERFRIGLVAFSNVADVMAPPTIDRTRVFKSISGLSPGGGTAIGNALAKAVRVLVEENRIDARQRLSAIVLLSDGASTSGIDPLVAAESARRANVPVFTVALGSLEPGGIPIVDPPDVETLQEIARATDARAFVAPTRQDLARIYHDLGSRMGLRPERREVTAAFAGAAGVLLLLGGLLSLRGRSRLP
jgi:Ca-activated chloride channel family protein